MAEVTQIDLGQVVGATGATGATGPTGPQGPGATITIGTVTTTTYGNPAQVTNSGTETDAVLDFVIPHGAPGEEVTDVSSLTLDSVTSTAASFPIPAVGEVMSVIMGKIIKFFGDTVAALNSKLNRSDVTTSLGVTTTGKALDATAGKNLNDAISTLNDSLNGLVKTREITATTSSIGAVALVGLNPRNSTPLIAYDIANNTYRIRRGTSEWVVIVTDPSDNDRVTNTEVAMYVRYIDKTN